MKETRLREKYDKVISEFKILIRSGNDYNVRSMLSEAGSKVFIGTKAAEKIVNDHYRSIITDEMIDYLNIIRYDSNYYVKKEKDKEVELFADKFNLCIREARLIIIYIKRMK